MTVFVLLLAVSRVVITEVMANPAGLSGAHKPEDRNEFVELYNPGEKPVDLFNWTINDLDAVDWLVAWEDSSVLGSNRTLIVGSTWLKGGGYAVVLDSEYTDPNPEGNFIQPYSFGDNTLIMTTRNTTIGNGLAINDPLILASPYGDTSTFGTPFDTSDSIPCNPGDGFSWERIGPDRPDTVDNWTVCPDPAGCTPGAPSSISSLPDLALVQLELEDTAALKPGEAFYCRVGIANSGFVSTDSWTLELFLDCNGNAVPDRKENAWRRPGWLLKPDEDSVVRVRMTYPQVQTDLWARILCPEDRDTINNQRRITLNPKAHHLLNFTTSSFSPDGDGFEDSLVIVYRLPEPGGKLTITVFNLAGQAVKEFSKERVKSNQGILYWDGKNNRDQPVPTGVYAIWLQYHRSDYDAVEKLPVLLIRRPSQSKAG